MIPSQLPSKPWEKVATDLFTSDKSKYLIIVDYHPRFFFFSSSQTARHQK